MMCGSVSFESSRLDHFDCVNQLNFLQSSVSRVKQNDPLLLELTIPTPLPHGLWTRHPVSVGYLWPAMQHMYLNVYFYKLLVEMGGLFFSAPDCMPGSTECWCGKWQLLLKIQRSIVPTEAAKQRVNWLIKYIQRWTVMGFLFPFCPFSTSANEVGSK